MKLLGKIATEEVVVMIDSGASNNFVSRMLVEKLGMKVDWRKDDDDIYKSGAGGRFTRDPALQRSVISLCSIANTSEVEFCATLFLYG